MAIQAAAAVMGKTPDEDAAQAVLAEYAHDLGRILEQEIAILTGRLELNSSELHRLADVAERRAVEYATYAMRRDVIQYKWSTWADDRAREWEARSRRLRSGANTRKIYEDHRAGLT